MHLRSWPTTGPLPGWQCVYRQCVVGVGRKEAGDKCAIGGGSGWLSGAQEGRAEALVRERDEETIEVAAD